MKLEHKNPNELTYAREPGANITKSYADHKDRPQECLRKFSLLPASSS